MINSNYCFGEENVLRNLSSQDSKDEVIKKLVNNILEVKNRELSIWSSQEEQKLKFFFLQEFLQRERQGSTGLQFGISIPHIKTSLIETTSLAVGISSEGVDFDSLDRKPSQIIVLSIVSSNQESLHLKFLSEFSRVLFQEKMRKFILEAQTNREVFYFIQEKIFGG